MKLRIRHNSIRLRLTQSEVAHFAEHGSIEEKLEFGPENNQLIYTLVSANIEKIFAEYKDNEITVFVPNNSVQNWAASDKVGFEAEQDIGEGNQLRILVEKDYACLDRRDGDDDKDTFPHPGQKISTRC